MLTKATLLNLDTHMCIYMYIKSMFAKENKCFLQNALLYSEVDIFTK